MPPPPKSKSLFTAQEYYGSVQSLEVASQEQGKMSLYPKGEAGRLSADLGVDLRAVSEFVEQVRVTSQGADGSAASTATAVITPALLEGVVHSEAAKPEGVDIAEMRAPALLGNYHAWKMKGAFPIPGSMLVDDVRRRYLSMYAGEAERALGTERAGREMAVEVRLAVMDGLEERRLPTAVEALLEQLGEVVRDKDEAVAANAQTELRTPAGEDDALVFDWLEARPPNLMAIEEKFSRGMVNVNAVHPDMGVSGLMRACKLGVLSVVRLFLKAGADASFTTSRGVSCLHVCWDRYMRLTKHATDMKRRISFECTKDIILALLEYGANANTAGANGITPLHMAAAYGHDSICAMLLRHGADRTWRDFRGLTPQGVAEKEGKRGAANLLANWAHIEKSYKDEEWRTEWYTVLKDNAAAARDSLESVKGKVPPPGTTGLGSPETRRRAQEALWGRMDDPSNPKRTAALSDTVAVLKGQATQEALAAHRAMARGSSDGAASAAQVLTQDPRAHALAVIPMAEYDMERDALRAVDVAADSEAMGGAQRYGAGSGSGSGSAKGMPWGMRPPPKLTVAQQERLTALAEEEEGIERARRRGEEEREAMRANAGLGEGELLLAKQARGKGRAHGDSSSSSSSSAPGRSVNFAKADAVELTVPPGRAVNLVAQDEVCAQLAGVYGMDGAGGFAPPSLREEVRMLEEAKAAADSAMAERLKAVEEEKAVQEEARAMLLGKKQKGMGQWVKNKFGRFNFVSDEAPAEAAAVLEKRAAAEARKTLRVDFEAATRRQREQGMGEKRLNALRFEKQKVAEVKAEEAAMNEDDLDELQRKREHDYMMKWYVGENKAPPSDGSVFAARRTAAAAALRADTPKFLPGFTALLPVPGSATGEQAVLTRKPAALSVLLRPSRFRTDVRPTVDGERIMAEGLAFESLVTGESILTLPLPPTNDALIPAEPDSEKRSTGAAGSLTGAAYQVVDREMAPEGAADRARTEDIRARVQRSLAGRGLTVPLRQGYGQLAANATPLLPYASFKRIAAESAGINPAGTSKTTIAAAAHAAYDAIVAESGRAREEGASARAAKASASAAALHNALDRSNVQRVRRTLDSGLAALAEDMEAAQSTLLAHNAHVLDEIDYTEHIPAGNVRTEVGEGRAPLAGQLFGRERAEAEALAATRKAQSQAAREELELKQRNRTLGLSKAQIPRTGAGALQTWPLHAPGPLALDTAPVGGAIPGMGAGGTAGMVFRHYSVLDAVATSKRLEAGERAAAAEALAAKRGLSKEQTEALRAAAGSGSGARPSSVVAAASRSRMQAIAALEKARETMSTQAHMMYAQGSTRAPAQKDRSVPLLSGAALETEDYLARVRTEREWEKKAAPEEEDTRGARDRIFDKHRSTADPWSNAQRSIDWDRIEGKGQLL